MRRRHALVPLVSLALAAPAASAAPAAKAPDWAKPQIAQVVGAGLMAKSVTTFDPQAPLTQAALEQVVSDLNARLAPPPQPQPAPAPVTTTDPAATTTDPAAVTTTVTTTLDPATGDPVTTTVVSPPPAFTPPPTPAPWQGEEPAPPEPPWPLVTWKAKTPSASVSLTEFDHVLVNTLGLSDAAAHVLSTLRSAGLKPPTRAGWETVARLVGLRVNHPAGQDSLELLPDQPITRAEAAFSVAKALAFGADDRAWIEQAADAFALPQLDDWQRRILTTAVHYVGWPYVWGGTSPGPQTPLGVSTPGGFDCSGFVWRVYNLTPYAGEGALASVIRGRTTYEMAAEARPKLQIRKVENLKPGDVLLFGKGPGSKPSEVDHAAIYLGNDWLVQSSGNGVTIAPFAGWYRSSFVFARRPLREAGLDR